MEFMIFLLLDWKKLSRSLKMLPRFDSFKLSEFVNGTQLVKKIETPINDAINLAQYIHLHPPPVQLPPHRLAQSQLRF